MAHEELIARLKQSFADVRRPDAPEGCLPEGRLGNRGWGESTYHSALMFAEQVPEHARRAFAFA